MPPRSRPVPLPTTNTHDTVMPPRVPTVYKATSITAKDAPPPIPKRVSARASAATTARTPTASSGAAITDEGAYAIPARISTRSKASNGLANNDAVDALPSRPTGVTGQPPQAYSTFGGTPPKSPPVRSPQKAASPVRRDGAGADGGPGQATVSRGAARAAAMTTLPQAAPAAPKGNDDDQEEYEYFQMPPKQGSPWEGRKKQMTRAEAEAALQGRASGYFLLRNAELPTFTKLSVVVSPTEIQHHLIKCSSSGVYEMNNILTPNLRSLDQVIVWLRNPENTPWKCALAEHL